MPYPIISSRRMPYDVDGTAVGIRQGGSSIANCASQGVASWLDSAAVGNLNKYDKSQTWDMQNQGFWHQGNVFWFFFPELREVNAASILFHQTSTNATMGDFSILGSADSTNGMDGTWETAVLTKPIVVPDADGWRSKIFEISFSGPMKVIKVGIYSNDGGGTNDLDIHAIHLFGAKAAGQNPDDILFTDVDGVEITSLTDWGDQPEGTEELWWFKLKNASGTKIANAVNLQLNHADFMMSLSPDGPWNAVLDITSIPAGSLSAQIYVRNKLGAPPLTLGPRAGRCIVTVGSWT